MSNNKQTMKSKCRHNIFVDGICKLCGKPCDLVEFSPNDTKLVEPTDIEEKIIMNSNCCGAEIKHRTLVGNRAICSKCKYECDAISTDDEKKKLVKCKQCNASIKVFQNEECPLCRKNPNPQPTDVGKKEVCKNVNCSDCKICQKMTDDFFTPQPTKKEVCVGHYLKGHHRGINTLGCTNPPAITAGEEIREGKLVHIKDGKAYNVEPPALQEWSESFDKQFQSGLKIVTIEDHKCEGWNDDDDLEMDTAYVHFNYEPIKQFISDLLKSTEDKTREALIEKITIMVKTAKDPYMVPATEKRFLQDIISKIQNNK